MKLTGRMVVCAVVLFVIMPLFISACFIPYLNFSINSKMNEQDVIDYTAETMPISQDDILNILEYYSYNPFISSITSSANVTKVKDYGAYGELELDSKDILHLIFKGLDKLGG